MNRRRKKVTKLHDAYINSLVQILKHCQSMLSIYSQTYLCPYVTNFLIECGEINPSVIIKLDMQLYAVCQITEHGLFVMQHSLVHAQQNE